MDETHEFEIVTFSRSGRRIDTGHGDTPEQALCAAWTLREDFVKAAAGAGARYPETRIYLRGHGLIRTIPEGGINREYD